MGSYEGVDARSMNEQFKHHLTSITKPLTQLGLPNLPPETPSADELTTEEGEPSQTVKDLHRLLLETSIASGKLVCGNCGHEYAVKEGIANFL